MMPNPAQNIPMLAPGGGVAGAGGGMAPMGGYPFPMNPQFYQSAYGAAYANQMQQWYYNYYQRLAQGLGSTEGRAGGRLVVKTAC